MEDALKATQKNGLDSCEKEGNRLLNVKINSYIQKVGPTQKCNPYYAIKGDGQ